MAIHYLRCIHAQREGDESACAAQGTKQVTTDIKEVTCESCRYWAATHEVVDFGDGPLDQVRDYPIAGTEAQCSDWMSEHNYQRADGKYRFGMQEVQV